MIITMSGCTSCPERLLYSPEMIQIPGGVGGGGEGVGSNLLIWRCAAGTLRPLPYPRLCSVAIGNPILDYTPKVPTLCNFSTDKFPNKWYPFIALIYIPYPRLSCLKTTPFTVAHTYLAYLYEYPCGSSLRADISWFLCFTQKRDVCVTASLIVFQ